MDFDDTPELASFRADARTWLEANAERKSEDAAPGALFTEIEDEAGYLAEARKWQALIFDAGWAGITWPEVYGGRELTPLYQIVWSQEAARYDLPLGVFTIGIGMGGPTVMMWGTEEQKQRWLSPMLRGDEIWCQMFSEPNAGSDVASVQTRAERDGDEWVVNGQKVWTSGAHYSKWGMLLARTDFDVPKHRGLTYFVVDMEQPGIEVRPLRQMTGGANFNEVFFADARITADGVLGGVGNGWGVALTTLMNERAAIGALGGMSGGSGMRMLRRLVDEIRDATGIDPIASPRERSRLIDIYIRGEVMRYLSQRMISRLARGQIPTAEGSAAKLALSDLAVKVTSLALDLQGPYGLLDDDAALLDGAWADAFVGHPGMRIAGGTDEIMRNIVGERVLGLPGDIRVDKDVPFRETRVN